jgi:hypothetical protein
MSFPGEYTTIPSAAFYTEGERNSTAVTFFEDANLATIIFAMTDKLKGTFNATVYAEDPDFHLNNSILDYQYFDACSSGFDNIDYLSRFYHTPLSSILIPLT